MAVKKKLTKPQKREIRLRKARQWALTYQGSHIVRDYRKRFHVDQVCALNDMKAIGALSPEKLAAMQQAERLRLQAREAARRKAAEESSFDMFPDSDDRFAFIAGYTPGGAPYGLTWEEMENIMPDAFPPAEDDD